MITHVELVTYVMLIHSQGRTHVCFAVAVSQELASSATQECRSARIRSRQPKRNSGVAFENELSTVMSQVSGWAPLFRIFPLRFVTPCCWNVSWYTISCIVCVVFAGTENRGALDEANEIPKDLKYFPRRCSSPPPAKIFVPFYCHCEHQIP